MSDKNARFRSWYSVLVLVADFVLINTLFLLLILAGNIFFDEKISEGGFFLALLFLNITYFPGALYNLTFHSQFVIAAEQLLARAITTVCIHVGLWLIFCFFFLPEQGCLLLVFLYAGLLILFLSLSWYLERNQLKKYRLSGRNNRSVVIVGGGNSGIALYREMTADPAFGYNVLGFFDDNETFEAELYHLWLGPVSELEPFLKANSVDELYNTLSEEVSSLNLKIINLAEKNFIRYYFVPGYFGFLKRRLSLSYLGNAPIMSIREEPLRSRFNVFFKRSFDIFFSLLVILLVYPVVFLLFGTLIKVTSPGPLFFVQRRTGLMGRDFFCYKFRTMVINEQSNTLQACVNDPRITWVGKFLRESSIDELPQFINVLRGDMSVVGPRPHMLSHTKQYSEIIDKYMIRHLVKPGITGLAQVSGFRGETKELWKMVKRVEYDVEYIENWSLALDIKIILLTFTLSFSKGK